MLSCSLEMLDCSLQAIKAACEDDVRTAFLGPLLATPLPASGTRLLLLLLLHRTSNLADVHARVNEKHLIIPGRSYSKMTFINTRVSSPDPSDCLRNENFKSPPI